VVGEGEGASERGVRTAQQEVIRVSVGEYRTLRELLVHGPVTQGDTTPSVRTVLASLAAAGLVSATGDTYRLTVSGVLVAISETVHESLGEVWLKPADWA